MSKKENMTELKPKVNTFQQAMIKNSEKGNIYAGKRFLGLTPRGAEVWISMELDRATKDLTINTTHNLNILLEEGAEPAKKRVTLKKGATSFYSTSDLIRRNQKNMGGEVTEATITYLKKLITASEMKDGKGYSNKEVTTLLFMYAANAIFEGTYDTEKGDFAWPQVIKTWGLPKGKYFLIESIPSSDDEVKAND